MLLNIWEINQGEHSNKIREIHHLSSAMWIRILAVTNDQVRLRGRPT